MPATHAKHLCTYHEADQATVASAIEGALAAKTEWEAMPWNDRAAIFLKAADLVSGKYRYKLMAATMLGQGKNAWQAEIDAAAEVSLSRKAVKIERLDVFGTARGLFPLRREVRRGVVLAATRQKRSRQLEVSLVLRHRLNAAHG